MSGQNPVAGFGWVQRERERRKVMPAERWPVGSDGEPQAPTGFQGRVRCPICGGRTWEDVQASWDDVVGTVGMDGEQRVLVAASVQADGPSEWRWCEQCPWAERTRAVEDERR